MKKILLDIDGILTDFHSTVINVACENGFHISLEQLEDWCICTSLKKLKAPKEIVDLCINTMSSDGFNLKLKPSEEALKYIPVLSSISDLYFITSPNILSNNWENERLEWMDKHFNVKKERIIFTQQKELYEGDMFVDDNPLNVYDWRNSQCGISIIWDAPYNKNENKCVRVHSWNELILVVEKDKP